MVDIGTGMVALGAALSIGLGALGTAYAQATIGAAGVGLLAEKEHMVGSVIMFVAIPETLAILGFVVAYLILTTLT